MNILAAVEKRPGRLSHISWQHHGINYNQVHIKFSSALLNCDLIWCSLCHYITITPLHLWWYQGWSSWGLESDGDPDFRSNLDITLLAHSLSGTSQPADQGTIEEIPHPPVDPKAWAVQREASCLFSLANTGRTNWCLKVSWITGEREQDAGIGM